MKNVMLGRQVNHQETDFWNTLWGRCIMDGNKYTNWYNWRDQKWW